LSVTGRLSASGGCRYSEVEESRYSVRSYEHVLRGNVAVDEVQALAAVVRRLVSGVQALKHPAHDPDADERRDPFTALPQVPNQLNEGDPSHVLHDEEDLVVLLDDVERGDHVGMCDTGSQPSFVEEHLYEVWVARELGVEPFDGDRTGEAGRTHEPPEVDRRHPARGDGSIEHVAPDHTGGAHPKRNGHLVSPPA
jgi:hypothetical protein